MDSVWAITLLLFGCAILFNGFTASQSVREVFDVMADEDLRYNRHLDEFCEDKLCLRRCCAEGEAIIGTECVNDSSSGIFELLGDQLNLKNTNNYSVVNSHEQYCSNDMKILPFDSKEVVLNGNILDIPELERSLEYKDFCVEISVIENVSLIILGCFSDERSYQLQGIGMIISMPFLFITFLVYLILPDKNVHQYALMLYVLTLLLAYVLLVTINLSESLPTFFCTGAAYGTLFLFMVSFFWMNVICFDIWYTFSGGRGYIVSSRKSERKRFLIYTAYAVGIPILHVCIVALLDKYLDEESIHKPNIGIKKCFLDDGWPSLWYMYGEAAILVLINVVFFTLTALKIRQVKKETLMLKQNESKRHALEKEKRRFNLFLKLFLAMGVNWTMEVISWLVNWQTTDKYTYIWYITDFINAVYGGVIFFIFVFKRKIWKMLQKRYYNFIGKPHLARAVTTTTDTRTSHYSSATDTNLTERTNITERRNNGIPTEELALRRA
ncbi:G-protein coupled receptor Mth2-like isoform X8 [Rhynchophorus ferrugineus]|uniref:G-protein coupled receptor Mth2-like isoform X8 n=1 Tax=Rhynchophorus ferrugineus TaxID=354439 RepID=UPI003FCE6FB7